MDLKITERTKSPLVVWSRFGGIGVNVWFSLCYLEIATEINIDINVGTCV